MELWITKTNSDFDLSNAEELMIINSFRKSDDIIIIVLSETGNGPKITKYGDYLIWENQKWRILSNESIESLKIFSGITTENAKKFRDHMLNENIQDPIR